MSELVIVNKTDLTSIADAIRGKTGKTDQMYISDMPDEIANISGDNSDDSLIEYPCAEGASF
jgi:hypothetical protein